MSGRDGANLGQSCDRCGTVPGPWLDLCHDVNPVPYPLADVGPLPWTTPPDVALLISAARAAYGAGAAEVVPAPGLGALLAALPSLGSGTVAVAAPEGAHAAAFRAQGWRVVDRPVPGTAALVIEPPQVPLWRGEEIALLAQAIPLLILDARYVDAQSAAHWPDPAHTQGLVILRDFTAFHGLAGVPLAFAICGPRTAQALRGWLGPDSIPAPIVQIATHALADSAWRQATAARLRADGARLAALGRGADWRVVADAGLCVTFAPPDASLALARLARHRILAGAIPGQPDLLRLGLPAPGDWPRIEEALA